MTDSPRFPKTLLFFVGLASFGLALWALQPYVSLFNSAFLAMIIVITITPLLNWLKRKGVPRTTMAIKELLLAADESLVWLAELLSSRGMDGPEAALPPSPESALGTGGGAAPG